MNIRCFVVILILSSCTAGAGEMVNGERTIRSVGEANTGGLYSKLLTCANRLHPPYASRIQMSGHLEDSGSRDERSTLFYGQADGKKGVIYVRPDIATLDQIPIYTPPNGRGMPGYPVVVTDAGGTESASHLYVENDRLDGASTGDGPEMRASNPGVNFTKLGGSGSKISEKSAEKAFETELIPAIKSMPGDLARTETFEKQRYGKSDMSARKDAHDALCACIRTGNSSIVAAAKAAGQSLEMKDLDKCDEPQVSSLFRYIPLLIASASAEPVRDSKNDTNDKLFVINQAIEELQIDGDKIEACSNKKRFKINALSGELITNVFDRSCEKRRPLDKACLAAGSLRNTIKGPVRDCQKNGIKAVAATSINVYLLDLEKKSSKLLASDGANHVAISQGWVAWSNQGKIHFSNLKTVSLPDSL